MLIRAIALTAAFVLVVLSGCGPAVLDVSKTIELDAAAKAIILDPQPKPQTLTVKYESSNCEVNVFVFKEADIPNDDVMDIAPAGKALASNMGAKSGTFTAEVPENTGVRVVVRGARTKTEVKFHITNKK